MSQRLGPISPPGGAPILRNALAQRAPEDAEAQLRAMLAARLPAANSSLTTDVTLYRSGREALRVALHALAEDAGRDEVIVPAYTCYSVPAAVVAAGLKVRLVEVDPLGRIDPIAISKLPLERAAAVIVCNLFGHCEPIHAWSALAEDAGVAIVDDAAQAFGARCEEGAAGARGAVGILSFGRGKPLAALGGGASLWHNKQDLASRNTNLPQAEATRPSSVRAAAAALLHDFALQPHVFQQLKRLPFLGIGETHFDPEFDTGSISSECLALAHAQLPRLDSDAARRRESAEALADALSDTPYTPLLASPASASTLSVYPRLAVRAPNATLRDRAVLRLAHFGAGRLYPQAACDVPALKSARVESEPFPVAAQLAADLFTMRTTRPYSRKDGEEIARLLEANHA
ncbi:MAG: aminotransferase class V-fold PLP-dependent enzyme [Myxococcota bacterium]